ncbi:MAG TPA: hypothetical protein VMM78_07610 [Thermomicrobiales bacterium]|nr:hypothetical protein [Thermomicrobiales bacterium]
MHSGEAAFTVPDHAKIEIRNAGQNAQCAVRNALDADRRPRNPLDGRFERELWIEDYAAGQ